METPSRFWDLRAADYARKPVADEAAYAQTLDRVRAYLTPNDRVLEIGCGTGTTAVKLAPNAREILGTDYSEEMIALARAKGRLEGLTHVRFEQRAVVDPALGRESFDVVLAMNLLHLLSDLPARLAGIRDLVRPGGLFISKTPCVGDQGFALRVVIPLMRAGGFAPYVNFVTERSVVASIGGAGFEVVETGYYPKKTRSLLVVARKAA